MKFIQILEELKKSYINNICVRNNGTLLLGTGTGPRSEHMLYAPLTDKILDEYLVSQYKFPFPKE